MATDLGKVGMRMRGTWSSSTAYEVLDAVSYNGSLYIAKQAVPANTLPTNTTYWQIGADASVVLQGYVCEVTISAINTGENFYFNLPPGIDNTYLPIVSLGTPVANAGYTARVFALITGENTLRININASFLQRYNIWVTFVKGMGALSPIEQ